VVIMMADESDDCRDVVRYWHKLNEGYDCVFGSRFMKGGGVIDYPRLKLLMNRLANFFLKVLFRIRLNDTTNAFKAYRKTAIDGCRPFISPHFNLTVELPLKAIVRGYSWTVIPITWRIAEPDRPNWRYGKWAADIFLSACTCGWKNIQPGRLSKAMNSNTADELQKIYGARFASNIAYRQRVWNILVPDFFQKFVRPAATVLDLGCGYGEFINNVRCGRKLAMDLNPDAPKYLEQGVRFLEQDCSTRWELDDSSLDVVFTSNFFEHLPDKAALGRTLDEIFRCLAPGGKIVAMGPNIKYLPGTYWDFWDHYLPLTEKSLGEGLLNRGFQIAECIPKFLPYTMVKQREYPAALLKLYLRIPLAWQIWGRQFVCGRDQTGLTRFTICRALSGSGPKSNAGIEERRGPHPTLSQWERRTAAMRHSGSERR